MDEYQIQDAIAAYASRIARLGGIARAKKLSATKAEGNRHEGIESGGEGWHEKG
jgi:hypothetical protein